MRVGLDVGGTKTDAVALADDGTIIARTRRATGWGPAEVTRTILDAVAGVAEATGIPRDAIRSVGVGIPGQVVPGTGRVSHAVNLGVEELDLGRALQPELGVPVHVENDVKAAALGAHALLAGPRRAESLAYLNLGTGIAAGIVAEGMLWRGTRGTAGEVGHISVDPQGPLCRCGQRGCIEALAGGGAVAERWGRHGALPVRDVFDAADHGDPLAAELRADIARGVAAAVRVLVLTADVDRVVLGGGITALGERLRADVAGELARSAEASAFMRSLHLEQRVEMLAPDSPAAALGAALVGDSHDPRHDVAQVLAHG